MRQGIAFKLGLLLATFSLVAMTIVAYYSYSSSRATLLGAAQRDLLTATQVLGRNFQARIDEAAGDVLLLARLPGALRVAGSDADTDPGHAAKDLADVFTAVMAVHPEYFQIRLIGAARHGLERVRVDRDRGELTRIATPELQEKGHYPYVFETLRLRSGVVHLSDIGVNHESGAHAGLEQPTVRLASPVAGPDGKVLGLIVIDLDLERLFVRLRSDMPQPYSLYMSNQWGDYLIHPDPSQTFGFDVGRRVFIQDAFAPVAELIQGRSQNAVTQVALDGSTGNGQVAAFVRLPYGPSAEKNFVILGLSQSLEKVLSETRQLGWTTVQMILGLAALAIALAALVARALTRRLRDMTGVVQKFSSEQVTSELPSDSGDEIGMLARSLNTMQSTIKANLGELIESRHQLKHLAQHDGLTELPNRALFDDRLRQALAQARRDQARVALLFVDLDGFKLINDTQGHHVGDLLLREVARRMEACVRNADTVGRRGGDEFVVLLPVVESDQDALRVAEKICAALTQRYELEGVSLTLSASIGVALFPQHGADESTLARSADAAMYHAKQAGGNRARLAGA